MLTFFPRYQWLQQQLRTNNNSVGTTAAEWWAATVWIHWAFQRATSCPNDSLRSSLTPNLWHGIFELLQFSAEPPDPCRGVTIRVSGRSSWGAILSDLCSGFLLQSGSALPPSLPRGPGVNGRVAHSLWLQMDGDDVSAKASAQSG